MQRIIWIVPLILCGACSGPNRGGELEAASAVSSGAASAVESIIDDEGLAASPKAEAPPPEPKEVEGETVQLFEPGKDLFGWRFDPGGEFPGATGTLSIDETVKKDGAPSLKLVADFTGGGAYVQMLKDCPGLDVNSLSFWLKTDAEIDSLSMRVIDSASICHQVRLHVKPTTDWQQITFPLRSFFANDRKDESVSRYESWGGPNDGAWHGPCKMVCLFTSEPKEQKKISLWVSRLEAVEPPERASTTALPVQLSAERTAPGSSVKIRYNWRPLEPLMQDNTVFVHFVDSTGKTRAQDDHTPAAVTGSPGWQGSVTYERRVLFPTSLEDGSYQILVGLYHSSPQPPGWKRLPLLAGPGTKDVGERRYLAGTLVIDRTAPLPKADTEQDPSLDLDGYEMTFSEEFDGKLDVSAWGPGTRWIAHTPWWGDFGDAAFADPEEGYPFTVKDGILRIEARRDENLKDQWGRKWQAGLISSNDPKGNGFSQQYGYFECRAKMPKGPGVWPAFWLASTYNRHTPEAGSDGSIEIDVIEYYGHNPGAYQSAVHVWKPEPHTAEGVTITTRMGEAAEDFHNYGVMVQPDFITMYFDGVAVWKKKTPSVHNKPLMLLVNLALGSGWPIDKTPNPSYMYVDHVRAYAKKTTP